MKQFNFLIFALLGFAFASLAYAQEYTYDFEVDADAYTNLQDPISINDGITWDDPQAEIPIGFEFQLFDKTISELILSENAGLGGLLLGETESPIEVAVLMAYGPDIIDRASDTINYYGEPGSLSPLSYLVEGEVGERIFKMEWNNVGFYADVDENGSSTDYTNFQMWLYEANNNVELRFGPTSIEDPDLAYEGEDGPLVAIAPSLNIITTELTASGIALTGSVDAPEAIETMDIDVTMEGTIAEGTVYRFVYDEITAIDEATDLRSEKISLHPNPVQDQLYIQWTAMPEQVEIMDMSGRLVRSVRPYSNGIKVGDLAPGMYVLSYVNENGRFASRFVKE